MVTFKTYDSFEDAFEDMRKNEEAANSRLKPSQRSIQWGDYWMAYYRDMDLLVCGHIYTMDENEKSEKAAGASDEEWDYTKETMLNSYERGYRFGMAYSVITPEGELGDTHISQMIPITKEQFEEARENRWSFENIAQLPWFREAVVNIFREVVG